MIIRDPHHSWTPLPANLTSTTCLSMKLNSCNVTFGRIIAPSLGQSYLSTSLDLISTSSFTGFALLVVPGLFSIFNCFQYPYNKTQLFSLTILNYPYSCHQVLMSRSCDIIHTFKDLSVTIRKIWDRCISCVLKTLLIQEYTLVNHLSYRYKY